MSYVEFRGKLDDEAAPVFVPFDGKLDEKPSTLSSAVDAVSGFASDAYNGVKDLINPGSVMDKPGLATSQTPDTEASQSLELGPLSKAGYQKIQALPLVQRAELAKSNPDSVVGRAAAQSAQQTVRRLSGDTLPYTREDVQQDVLNNTLPNPLPEENSAIDAIRAGGAEVGRMARTGEDLARSLNGTGFVPASDVDLNADEINQINENANVAAIGQNLKKDAQSYHANSVLGKVVESTLHMAPAIALSLVNPAAGIGAFAGQAEFDAARNAIQEGHGLTNAQLKGLAQAALMSVGGEFVGKGTSSLLQKIPGGMFAPTIVDSVASALQRSLQGMGIMAAFKPIGTAADVAADMATGETSDQGFRKYEAADFVPGAADLITGALIPIPHSVAEYRARSVPLETVAETIKAQPTVDAAIAEAARVVETPEASAPTVQARNRAPVKASIADQLQAIRPLVRKAEEPIQEQRIPDVVETNQTVESQPQAPQQAGTEIAPLQREIEGVKPEAQTLSQEAVSKPQPPSELVTQERRHYLGLREAINHMSPSEKDAALLDLHRLAYTSDKTGLPNRRAYLESEKLPAQVFADADSLKWVNDNISHDAGDDLLSTIGEAIRAETPNGYHVSGDEFFIQANSPEEARQIMTRVNSRLNSAILEWQGPNGESITLNGIGLSHGIGSHIEAAESASIQHKSEREALGLRGARGEQPPNAVRSGWDRPRLETGQDNAPPEVTSESTQKTPADAGVSVSEGTKPPDISRDTKQAESAPALAKVPDISADKTVEIARAKEALDAAGVTGVDRTSTIAAVRRGDLTAEDVAESHGQKITDFGEKIVGAKKDLWQNYKKAMAEHLPADAKEITLSKHFPEPDYENLIAAGNDIRTVAAIKAMRDEIPTKPQKSYKLSVWADQVRMLKEFANRLINGTYDIDHVLNKMREAGRLGELADRIELYSELGYPAFKAAKGFEISGGWKTEISGTTAGKEQYGLRDSNGRLSFFDTRREAVDALRARLESAPEGEGRSTKLDIYRVTTTGDIVIGKKVASNKFIDLKPGFKSAREAREYLKNNEADLLALLAKKKEVAPTRRSTNNPRIGEDYREGEDVTPEKFAAEFGFRGVQFGNYVEAGRRPRDLNNAYDALLDLSHIIGVPPRALSLNGSLGLAFGARGSGGVDAAAAHYEPNHVVINLTKTNGFGSLAHEVFHAMDNYFAKAKGEDNGFMTGNPNASSSAVRPEVVRAFKDLKTEIKASDFYRRSVELDQRRTKDYWSTDHELAARAFEAYVISKAEAKGESNDYLANIIDEETHNVSNSMAREFGLPEEPYPYPTKEDQAKFNPLFDKLFATLKTKVTDKGVALYSRSQEPLSNPHTVESLRADLGKAIGEKLMAGLEKTGKVKIISAEEAKDIISKDSLRNDNGRPLAFFNPQDGKTYFIHDNIPATATAAQLRGMALHELGNHALELGLGTKEYAGIQSQFELMAKAGNADAKAALERARTAGVSPENLNKEGLGYLVEAHPDLPFVKRVISWFRSLVFKAFGENALRLKTDDIVYMAQQALKGAPERLAAQENSRLDSPLFSARDRTNIETATRRMSKFVDEYIAGRLKDSDTQDLGNTPTVLQALGADALPLIVDGAGIRHVLEDRHSHLITADMLKQLPKAIFDPLLVFNSPSGKGLPGKFLFTELIARDGSPVVVAIHLNKEGARNRFHRIASAYDWQNAGAKLKAMASELEYYRNEQSLVQPTMPEHLDLPGMVQAARSLNKNILTEADVVKNHGPLFSRADVNPGQQDLFEGTKNEVRDRLAKYLKVPSEMVTSGKLSVIPMAEGSDTARVVAKEYANQERRAQWQWSRFDNLLKKNFTEEQRKNMWEAADEENDLRREGIKDPSRGLGRLNEEERAAVETLHDYGEELMARARNAGMFEGEGVPYWTPRMAVMIDGSGEYTRPSSGAPGQTTSGKGGNISTYASSLQKRKYLTSAETEAAMKARLNEGDKAAELVRDIRTMPMAMARIEKAIAARELINQIKAIGRAAGTETVSTSEGPTFFTIDHPAFKTFKPRFEEVDGKVQVVKDANGDVVFEKVPIFISKEFEGPLKAIMTEKSGPIYLGMMSLKSKAMGLIMYSPLIHNAVEWGRSFPAMDMKGKATLGVYTYLVGNKAKHDPAQMLDAIDHGLVPIGGRGQFMDITGIAEDPMLKAGRSWTAKALAAPVALISEKGANNVKKAVDAAGKFWHETLLWDRVGDLQMGLYTSMKSSYLNKGFSEMEAGIMAAHFANRFAGALPREAMSQAATKFLNLTLFSRTFTLGNIGVMKDMITGLPKDIQAQIRISAGELAAKAAVSQARKTAIATVLIDIGLMYTCNSLLQDFLNKERENGDTYKERGGRLLDKLKADPVSVLTHPFNSIESLTPTGQNEPGKEERIKWGRDSTGTEIYMRLPVGKIGEEFGNYLGGPGSALKQLKNKTSTFMRPLLDTWNNEDYFGRKVYDDSKDASMLKQASEIAVHFMKSQVPTDQVMAAYDLSRGHGDDMDVKKLVGPLLGVTFSKGAPGGPEVGEIYAADREYRDRIVRAMPDARRALKYGEEDKARDILEKAGMTPREINRTIHSVEVPESRINRNTLKRFQKHATDEQKDRMDRLR